MKMNILKQLRDNGRIDTIEAKEIGIGYKDLIIAITELMDDGYVIDYNQFGKKDYEFLLLGKLVK